MENKRKVIDAAEVAQTLKKVHNLPENQRIATQYYIAGIAEGMNISVNTTNLPEAEDRIRA